MCLKDNSSCTKSLFDGVFNDFIMKHLRKYKFNYYIQYYKLASIHSFILDKNYVMAYADDPPRAIYL